MIILASKSQSRRQMLEAADIPFEARAADVQERAIEAEMEGARPDQVALALAEAKARVLGAEDAYVIGSDSLAVVGAQRFDKPADRDQAAEHLRFFSGRMMQLHSAAAIARRDEIVWRHAGLATLQFRELSEPFIERYLDEEWPEVGNCVGVFRIEGRGVQLFDRIDGDRFVVLGMPLIPVLVALRELGELPA